MCESKNNEYLKTMKPTIFMMKIVCAMPLCIEPKHSIPSVLSSRMVSLMAIVACIIYHVHFGSETIKILTDKNIMNIITLVGRYPEIIFEFFSLIVPLMMLNRNKQMQDYWNTWEILQAIHQMKQYITLLGREVRNSPTSATARVVQFHTSVVVNLKYEDVTGTPYISRKRKYIVKATLFCISWLAFRNCYAVVFHYYIFIDILDFIGTAYSHLLLYTLLTYWFANCAYFRSTSEDILILGKKIIVEKEENWKLNKLIAIWSNLNDLTNRFNHAHSFLFLSVFTTIVTIIVAYSYALINYSVYRIVYPFTYFSSILLLVTCCLLILCESSHSVHRQMCYRQKEALLRENTMKMEIPMLQSVIRFLQTACSQNSAINFNGFFTLTRMEFPVIIALCLNYLIVLRQFSEN